MFRRRRPWHQPETGGWRKAFRGLLVAGVGVGVPIAVWIWISSAVTPRPEEQPPPPALGRADVPAPERELEGAWVLDPDSSWVGYRIEERIPRLGELFEVVGRTDRVAGRLVLDDTTIDEGWVEADLRAFAGDKSAKARKVGELVAELAAEPLPRLELRAVVFGALLDCRDHLAAARGRELRDLPV